MFKRLANVTASLLVLMTLLLLSCGKYYEGNAVSLKSPDGKVEARFELKEMEQPYPYGQNMYYSVYYGGKQLLKESSLGVNFGEAGVVMSNLLIMDVKESKGTDQFDTPLSKQSSVSAEYNEVVISLREKTIPAKTFNLTFRAYNEGLAFRYDFPEQEPNIAIPSAGHKGFLKDFTLTNELTSYVFPEDVTLYAGFITSFNQNYEFRYEMTKVSGVSRDSTAALPFVALYEGGPAICVTEAALENYPAQYVAGAREMDNTLVSVLVPMPGEKELKLSGQVPFKSPWRVIMIADTPGKLIESNLVLCLNEPSKVQDVSWIKPGKATWDWWSGRLVEGKRGKPEQGAFSNETYQKYVDFAADQKFEYFLVDAGWYGMDKDPEADITAVGVEGVNIPELVKYAAGKGVKILLWLNWENVKKQMDKAFPLYESWGVAGVKIDYMNRDDAEMVKFYHDVVALAADHHLLVDFHGAYKPTGERRTWPNLITREAVMGLEYDKWSTNTDPEHDVTIPYTRMLVGPMDFTPGAFNNATQKGFKPVDIDPMSQGTRCHQLAMFVVYESPLQVMADAPVNANKAAGMDFISQVPTTWDATKFIQGEIGNYIVLARKKGDLWYLGAMTDWDAREIEVPLSDILGSGNWNMKVWADGAKAEANPEDVAASEQQIAGTQALKINLASGGGYVAVFEPAR